jgi:hypothetical protein
MQSLTTERAQSFCERHRAIDLLRTQRESGGPLALNPAVRALLQELDLLQVVAQAAEHVAGYPAGASAEEVFANLRYSLRRWKE